MLIIEEFPPTNPNKDTTKDTIDTLNFILAKQTTKLTAAAIASLAGIK
ncbi:MAG: hypothetical protein ACTSP3_13600 [Candidatus Heimdallarchaeaceae archaeon]